MGVGVGGGEGSRLEGTLPALVKAWPSPPGGAGQGPVWWVAE